MTNVTFKGRHTLPIVVVGVFVIALVLIPTVALAARTVNSITVTSAHLNSIHVIPNQSLTVNVTVTTNGSGTDYDWNTTAYRIEGGSWQCANTSNHNGSGTYTESFSINVPSSPGTYDLSVRAYKDNSCSSGESEVLTLSNAIIVIPAYAVDTYSNTSYLSLKNSFNTGETIYGRGVKNVGNQYYLRIRYYDPDNHLIKTCDTSPNRSFVIACDYHLQNDDKAGQWTIKLFGESDDNTPDYVLATNTFTVVRANYCGDGNVAGDEQCDSGRNNGNVCTPSYGNNCDYCSNDCDTVTVQGAYCGDQIKNGDEQCDGQAGCSKECTWEPATIFGHKVVCDSEAYLPDWGVTDGNKPAGAPSVIDENTAQNWVDQSDGHCWIDNQWGFQWAYDPAGNPGNNIDNASWDSFTTINPLELTDFGNGKIWLREVPATQWVPFSADVNTPTPKTSAEFYCGNDILNYDNYEWIGDVNLPLVNGGEYHCVGFNTQIEAGCGNDIVDPGEQCDGSSYCTDQCVQNYFIDGYKWNDLNGDSQKTADEPLMGGWTIQLKQNGEVIDTDVTDTEGDYFGHYRFENLPAGDYTVCEIQQDGWTQTFPVNGECHDVTLSGPLMNVPQPNFGNTEIPTYDLHGYKWNDLNGDGERCSFPQVVAQFSDSNINAGLPSLEPMCEPLLCDWTIQLKQNGIVIDETKTSCEDNPDYGWYWFEGLVAGTYEVCEVQQDGWTQTYPENCHEITLPLNQLVRETTVISDNYVSRAPELNFGNMEVAPVCGDGIVNQVTEQCDGTAGITGDQTCSNDCMIVNPATPVITFTLAKTVDKATANPGDTLTYTVKVTNTGNTAATNVTLTDTLPTGLTYLDADGNNTGDTTKTWTWPTLAAGASETVTYKAHVDSNATAKAYVNTATVSAEGVPGITAQATSEVKTPTVLGEEVATLTITKTVAEKTVNPGGTLNFTVVVTNTGTTPANNVILTDTLPQGMVFADNNTTTHSWNLGDLVPTESVTTTYAVKVDAGIIPGKYVNTASAKADDVASVMAQANVEVIAGQVLGEETDIVPTVTTLPSTGADILPSLIAGLSLLGSGLILIKRGKK
ncbi:MAG: SdrD B-like domain-containing protein [Patescibacteria group bacterium]